MNRKSLKKPSKTWLRGISFLTLLTFIVSSFSSPLSAAQAGAIAQATAFKSIDSPSLSIAQNLGTIEDTYHGADKRFIILLQDAHAVPDAQKNASEIIQYLQKEYGLQEVAVEGAAGFFDTQFLKSFPDKKRLKIILEEYMSRGELTGAGMASILSEAPSHFQGIENWALYEKANELFLKSLEGKAQALKVIAGKKKELDSLKSKIYSPELLKVDQLLNEFEDDQKDFAQVLEKMFEIEMPHKGTELDVLFEHFSDLGKDDKNLNLQVRGKAEMMRKMIGDDHNKNSAEKLTAFNKQLQNFNISTLSSREFAFWMMDFASNEKMGIDFSADWKTLQNDERRLRNLEGSKVFGEFEDYSAKVKEKLFRGDAERKLDLENSRLRLALKMAKLELSPKDWAAAKTDAEIKNLLPVNYEFYVNSEKRDEVFFEKLQKLSASQNPVLFISGGFHTQGLKELLKKSDISYAVVRPQIKNIPDKEIYLRQMRGEVSWKSYLKDENGKINLYRAFMRGARDGLIGTDSGVSVKDWRDQLIRDLAESKRIEQASKYTSFLDETILKQKSTQPSWLTNLNKIIEGFKALDKRHEFNQDNILKLLSNGHVLQLASGNASFVPVDSSESFLLTNKLEAVRSEMRNEPTAIPAAEIREEFDPAVLEIFINYAQQTVFSAIRYEFPEYQKLVDDVMKHLAEGQKFTDALLKELYEGLESSKVVRPEDSLHLRSYRPAAASNLLGRLKYLTSFSNWALRERYEFMKAAMHDNQYVYKGDLAFGNSLDSGWAGRELGAETNTIFLYGLNIEKLDILKYIDDLEKFIFISHSENIFSALKEAFKNAVVWGNRNDNKHFVVIRWRVIGDDFVLDIIDEGKKAINFDSIQNPPPNLSNPDQRLYGYRAGYKQYYKRYFDSTFSLFDSKGNVVGQVVRLKFGRSELRAGREVQVKESIRLAKEAMGQSDFKTARGLFEKAAGDYVSYLMATLGKDWTKKISALWILDWAKLSSTSDVFETTELRDFEYRIKEPADLGKVLTASLLLKNDYYRKSSAGFAPLSGRVYGPIEGSLQAEDLEIGERVKVRNSVFTNTFQVTGSSTYSAVNKKTKEEYIVKFIKDRAISESLGQWWFSRLGFSTVDSRILILNGKPAVVIKKIKNAINFSDYENHELFNPLYFKGGVIRERLLPDSFKKTMRNFKLAAVTIQYTDAHLGNTLLLLDADGKLLNEPPIFIDFEHSFGFFSERNGPGYESYRGAFRPAVLYSSKEIFGIESPIFSGGNLEDMRAASERIGSITQEEIRTKIIEVTETVSKALTVKRELSPEILTGKWMAAIGTAAGIFRSEVRSEKVRRKSFIEKKKEIDQALETILRPLPDINFEEELDGWKKIIMPDGILGIFLGLWHQPFSALKILDLGRLTFFYLIETILSFFVRSKPGFFRNIRLASRNEIYLANSNVPYLKSVAGILAAKKPSLFGLDVKVTGADKFQLRQKFRTLPDNDLKNQVLGLLEERAFIIDALQAVYPEEVSENIFREKIEVVLPEGSPRSGSVKDYFIVKVKAGDKVYELGLYSGLIFLSRQEEKVRRDIISKGYGPVIGTFYPLQKNSRFGVLPVKPVRGKLILQLMSEGKWAKSYEAFLERLFIFQDLGYGLGDVKEDNLIVEDDTGKPVIIDFTAKMDPAGTLYWSYQAIQKLWPDFSLADAESLAKLTLDVFKRKGDSRKFKKLLNREIRYMKKEIASEEMDPRKGLKIPQAKRFLSLLENPQRLRSEMRAPQKQQESFLGKIYMLNKRSGDLTGTTPYGGFGEKVLKTPITLDSIPAEFRAADRAFFGQLDKETTGLILYGRTAGGLSEYLLNPNSPVKDQALKVYEVIAAGTLNQDRATEELVTKGVEINTARHRQEKQGREPKAVAKMVEAEVLGHFNEGDEPRTRLRVVLDRGYKQQIRQSLGNIGHKVTVLNRTSIGQIKLDPALAEGDVRELNTSEYKYLEDLFIAGLRAEGKNELAEKLELDRRSELRVQPEQKSVENRIGDAEVELKEVWGSGDSEIWGYFSAAIVKLKSEDEDRFDSANQSLNEVLTYIEKRMAEVSARVTELVDDEKEDLTGPYDHQLDVFERLKKEIAQIQDRLIDFSDAMLRQGRESALELDAGRQSEIPDFSVFPPSATGSTFFPEDDLELPPQDPVGAGLDTVFRKAIVQYLKRKLSGPGQVNITSSISLIGLGMRATVYLVSINQRVYKIVPKFGLRDRRKSSSLKIDGEWLTGLAVLEKYLGDFALEMKHVSSPVLPVKRDSGRIQDEDFFMFEQPFGLVLYKDYQALRKIRNQKIFDSDPANLKKLNRVPRILFDFQNRLLSEKGIIVFDMNPKNIVLINDVPALSDFDLARLAQYDKSSRRFEFYDFFNRLAPENYSNQMEEFFLLEFLEKMLYSLVQDAATPEKKYLSDAIAAEVGRMSDEGQPLAKLFYRMMDTPEKRNELALIFNKEERVRLVEFKEFSNRYLHQDLFVFLTQGLSGIVKGMDVDQVRDELFPKRSELRMGTRETPSKVGIKEYLEGSRDLDLGIAGILEQIKKGNVLQYDLEKVLSQVKGELEKYIKPFSNELTADGRAPQTILERFVDEFLRGKKGLDTVQDFSVLTIPMTAANSISQETGTWLKNRVYELVKSVMEEPSSRAGFITSESTAGSAQVYLGTSIGVTGLTSGQLQRVLQRFENEIKPELLKKADEKLLADMDGGRIDEMGFSTAKAKLVKMINGSQIFAARTSKVVLPEEIKPEIRNAVKRNDLTQAATLIERAVLQQVKATLAQSEVIQDFFKFLGTVPESQRPPPPGASVLENHETIFDEDIIRSEIEKIVELSHGQYQFNFDEKLKAAQGHFIPLGNFHTRHIPRLDHEVKNLKDTHAALIEILLNVEKGEPVSSDALLRAYRKYRLWLGRMRLISALDIRYNLAFTKEGGQIIVDADNDGSLDTLLRQLNVLYRQTTESDRDSSFMKWKSILFGLLAWILPLLWVLGLDYDFLNPQLEPARRTLRDFRKIKGFYLIKFGGDEISIASRVRDKSGKVHTYILAVGDFDKFKRYNQEVPRTDFDDNFYIFFDAILRAAKKMRAFKKVLSEKEFIKLLRLAQNEILRSTILREDGKPLMKVGDFKFQYEQKIQTRDGKMERILLWKTTGEKGGSEKVFAIRSDKPSDDSEVYSLSGQYLGLLKDLGLLALEPYEGTAGFTANTTTGIGDNPADVENVSNLMADYARLQKKVKDEGLPGFSPEDFRFMTQSQIEDLKTRLQEEKKVNPEARSEMRAPVPLQRAEEFSQAFSQIYTILDTIPPATPGMRGIDKIDDAVNGLRFGNFNLFPPANRPAIQSWADGLKAKFTDIMPGLKIGVIIQSDLLFDGQDRAVVLNGKSGAGKSSLSYAFSQLLPSRVALGSEDRILILQIPGHLIAASAYSYGQIRARAYNPVGSPNSTLPIKEKLWAAPIKAWVNIESKKAESIQLGQPLPILLSAYVPPAEPLTNPPISVKVEHQIGSNPPAGTSQTFEELAKKLEPILFPSAPAGSAQAGGDQNDQSVRSEMRAAAGESPLSRMTREKFKKVVIVSGTNLSREIIVLRELLPVLEENFPNAEIQAMAPFLEAVRFKSGKLKYLPSDYGDNAKRMLDAENYVRTASDGLRNDEVLVIHLSDSGYVFDTKHPVLFVSPTNVYFKNKDKEQYSIKLYKKGSPFADFQKTAFRDLGLEGIDSSLSFLSEENLSDQVNERIRLLKKGEPRLDFTQNGGRPVIFVNLFWGTSGQRRIAKDENNSRGEKIHSEKWTNWLLELAQKTNAYIVLNGGGDAWQKNGARERVAKFQRDLMGKAVKAGVGTQILPVMPSDLLGLTAMTEIVRETGGFGFTTHSGVLHLFEARKGVRVLASEIDPLNGEYFSSQPNLRVLAPGQNIMDAVKDWLPASRSEMRDWYAAEVKESMNAEQAKINLTNIREELLHVRNTRLAVSTLADKWAYTLDREDSFFSDEVINAYGQSIEEFNHFLNQKLEPLQGPALLETAYLSWHRLLAQSGDKYMKKNAGQLTTIYNSKGPDEVRALFKFMFTEQFNREVTEDPFHTAAGVFFRLRNSQALDEGNHRMAGLMMNYVLLKAGKKPFLLSPQNAAEYISSLRFGVEALRQLLIDEQSRSEIRTSEKTTPRSEKGKWRNIPELSSVNADFPEEENPIRVRAGGKDFWIYNPAIRGYFGVSDEDPSLDESTLKRFDMLQHPNSKTDNKLIVGLNARGEWVSSIFGSNKEIEKQLFSLRISAGKIEVEALSGGVEIFEPLDLKVPMITFPGRMNPAFPVIRELVSVLASAQASGQPLKIMDFGASTGEVSGEQAAEIKDELDKSPAHNFADYYAVDQFIPDFVVKAENWEATIKVKNGIPEILAAYPRSNHALPPEKSEILNFASAKLQGKKIPPSELMPWMNSAAWTRPPYRELENDLNQNIRFHTREASFAEMGSIDELQGKVDLLTAYNVFQYYKDARHIIKDKISPLIREGGFFILGRHNVDHGDIKIAIYQKINGELVFIQTAILSGMSNVQGAGRVAAFGASWKAMRGSIYDFDPLASKQHEIESDYENLTLWDAFRSGVAAAKNRRQGSAKVFYEGSLFFLEQRKKLIDQLNGILKQLETDLKTEGKSWATNDALLAVYANARKIAAASSSEELRRLIYSTQRLLTSSPENIGLQTDLLKFSLALRLQEANYPLTFKSSISVRSEMRAQSGVPDFNDDTWERFTTELINPKNQERIKIEIRRPTKVQPYFNLYPSVADEPGGELQERGHIDFRVYDDTLIIGDVFPFGREAQKLAGRGLGAVILNWLIYSAKVNNRTIIKNSGTPAAPLVAIYRKLIGDQVSVGRGPLRPVAEIKDIFYDQSVAGTIGARYQGKHENFVLKYDSNNRDYEVVSSTAESVSAGRQFKISENGEIWIKDSAGKFSEKPQGYVTGFTNLFEFEGSPKPDQPVFAQPRSEMRMSPELEGILKFIAAMPDESDESRLDFTAPGLEKAIRARSGSRPPSLAVIKKYLKEGVTAGYVELKTKQKKTKEEPRYNLSGKALAEFYAAPLFPDARASYPAQERLGANAHVLQKPYGLHVLDIRFFNPKKTVDAVSAALGVPRPEASRKINRLGQVLRSPGLEGGILIQQRDDSPWMWIVPFKTGGHEYLAVINLTDEKPLNVFLQQIPLNDSGVRYEVSGDLLFNLTEYQLHAYHFDGEHITELQVPGNPKMVSYRPEQNELYFQPLGIARSQSSGGYSNSIQLEEFRKQIPQSRSEMRVTEKTDTMRFIREQWPELIEEEGIFFILSEKWSALDDETKNLLRKFKKGEQDAALFPRNWIASPPGTPSYKAMRYLLEELGAFRKKTPGNLSVADLWVKWPVFNGHSLSSVIQRKAAVESQKPAEVIPEFKEYFGFVSTFEHKTKKPRVIWVKKKEDWAKTAAIFMFVKPGTPDFGSNGSELITWIIANRSSFTGEEFAALNKTLSAEVHEGDSAARFAMIELNKNMLLINPSWASLMKQMETENIMTRVLERSVENWKDGEGALFGRYLSVSIERALRKYETARQRTLAQTKVSPRNQVSADASLEKEPEDLALSRSELLKVMQPIFDKAGKQKNAPAEKFWKRFTQMWIDRKMGMSLEEIRQTYNLKSHQLVSASLKKVDKLLQPYRDEIETEIGKAISLQTETPAEELSAEKVPRRTVYNPADDLRLNPALAAKEIISRFRDSADQKRVPGPDQMAKLFKNVPGLQFSAGTYSQRFRDIRTNLNKELDQLKSEDDGLKKRIKRGLEIYDDFKNPAALFIVEKFKGDNDIVSLPKTAEIAADLGLTGSYISNHFPAILGRVKKETETKGFDLEVKKRIDSAIIEWETGIAAKRARSKKRSELRSSEKVNIGKDVYQIEKTVGRGGVGVVYLAHKAERPDLKFSLKTANRGFASDVSFAREYFKHEFEILKLAYAADPQYFPKPYEYGEDSESKPWIIMEYIEGKELGSSLNEDKDLKTAEELLRGLKVLHDSKIVFADLKSPNILVTKTGQVKIIDFGLAQLNGIPGPYKNLSDFIGTKGSHAPEMQKGVRGFDPKVDIFEAGLILYELATEGEILWSDIGGKYMFDLLDDVDFDEKISPEWRPYKDLILGSLEEKPENRKYANAGEMLADFLRIKEQSAAANPARSEVRSVYKAREVRETQSTTLDWTWPGRLRVFQSRAVALITEKRAAVGKTKLDPITIIDIGIGGKTREDKDVAGVTVFDLVRALKEAGYHNITVYGVDNHQPNVLNARAALEKQEDIKNDPQIKLEFVEGDIFNFEKTGLRGDIILSANTLFYYTPEEVLDVRQKLTKFIEPYGFLGFAVVREENHALYSIYGSNNQLEVSYSQYPNQPGGVPVESATEDYFQEVVKNRQPKRSEMRGAREIPFEGLKLDPELLKAMAQQDTDGRYRFNNFLDFLDAHEFPLAGNVQSKVVFSRYLAGIDRRQIGIKDNSGNISWISGSELLTTEDPKQITVFTIFSGQTEIGIGKVILGYLAAYAALHNKDIDVDSTRNFSLMYLVQKYISNKWQARYSVSEVWERPLAAHYFYPRAVSLAFAQDKNLQLYFKNNGGRMVFNSASKPIENDSAANIQIKFEGDRWVVKNFPEQWGKLDLQLYDPIDFKLPAGNLDFYLAQFPERRSEMRSESDTERGEKAFRYFSETYNPFAVGFRSMEDPPHRLSDFLNPEFFGPLYRIQSPEIFLAAANRTGEILKTWRDNGERYDLNLNPDNLNSEVLTALRNLYQAFDIVGLYPNKSTGLELLSEVIDYLEFGGPRLLEQWGQKFLQEERSRIAPFQKKPVFDFPAKNNTVMIMDLAGTPMEITNPGEAYNLLDVLIDGKTLQSRIQDAYGKKEVKEYLDEQERKYYEARRKLFAKIWKEMLGEFPSASREADVIYYPFGGFDPTGLAMTSSTQSNQDNITQGGENFGSLWDLSRFFYTQKKTGDELYLSGFNAGNFDAVLDMEMFQHQYQLSGLGALAIARIIAFMKGEIQGVYFFDYDQEGKIKFFDKEKLEQEESKSSPVNRNALILYKVKDPETGEIYLRRYWYLQHLFQETDPGFSKLVKKIAKRVKLLLFKGAPAAFEDGGGSDPAALAQDTLDPIRLLNPSALVVTDNAYGPRGYVIDPRRSYPIWVDDKPPLAIALKAGEHFGYSSGWKSAVYAGLATSLKNFTRRSEMRKTALPKDLSRAAQTVLRTAMNEKVTDAERGSAADIFVTAGAEKTIRELEELKSKMLNQLPESTSSVIDQVVAVLSKLPPGGVDIAYSTQGRSSLEIQDFVNAIKRLGQIKRVLVSKNEKVPEELNDLLRKEGIMLSRVNFSRPGIEFSGDQTHAGVVSSAEVKTDSALVPIISLENEQLAGSDASRLVIALQTAVALLVAQEIKKGNEIYKLKPAELLSKYKLFEGFEKAIVSGDGQSIRISGAGVMAYLQYQASQQLARSA